MNSFKKAFALFLLGLFAVSTGFQTQAFANHACELCAKSGCKDHCPCHGTENCGGCKGHKE